MDEVKFNVEVKTDHYNTYLSVTHNGYQWTSININNPRHEIPLIIEALTQYLYEYTLGVKR